MIDFLFLDTYHVSSPEDVFNWYAFFKDIIVPFSAIVVSIYVVYLGIKKQNELQYENKKKEELEAKNFLRDILVSNNPFLIENIDTTFTALHRTIDALTLSTIENFSITTISNVHFKIVRDFGYVKLFELIDREQSIDRDAFSKYWVAIDTFASSYDKIFSYLEMAHANFYKQNEKLNNLNHLIAVQTSNNIHTRIPPFTTIRTNEIAMRADPQLKLAVRSHEITQEFNSSTEPLLVKLKAFLDNLFELKNDRDISRIIDSDYVQKIEQASSILKGMESSLMTAKASINNYLPIFEKNRMAIETFNTILSGKLVQTMPAKKCFWKKLTKCFKREE